MSDTPNRRTQGGDQFQSFFEMLNAFQIGVALQGVVAGFFPERDGLGKEPGFRIVVRQQFRLNLCRIGKLSFQHLGHLLV